MCYSNIEGIYKYINRDNLKITFTKVILTVYNSCISKTYSLLECMCMNKEIVRLKGVLGSLHILRRNGGQENGGEVR